MILHDLNSIFIHVPKKAGNYLTKNYFHRFSKDFITDKGHQDGVNRFEVKGDVTEKKHMTLPEYERFLDLKDYYLIVPVREPVERLVSLYFSPHRSYKKKQKAKFVTQLSRILGMDIDVGQRGYKKEDIKLSMKEFSKLINSEENYYNYLKGYEKCKGVFLIRNESIINDLKKVFDSLGVTSFALSNNSEAINKSGRKLSLTQYDQCRDLIMESHHANDLSFIEELNRVSNN